MTDPFDDKGIHLKGFPDATLLDIARNGSAQRDYRLTAVEILKTRKSPRINHPDIQDLVRELEIELDGIVFENPAPSGALKASVTTKTMAEDVEVIDNTPHPQIPEDYVSVRGKSIPTQAILIRPGDDTSDLNRLTAHETEVRIEDNPRLAEALALSEPEEVDQIDVPPTEPETIPTGPKAKRTRKSKEPVDDPQPE